MPIVKKFSMYAIAVKDMAKMTNFYADALGLEVTQDYRQDDENWWIKMTLPEGGVSITLSLEKEGMKPGTMTAYFETDDIEAARTHLIEKNVDVSDVQNDLYGPGSNVKFISLQDPEGNPVLLVQE